MVTNRENITSAIKYKMLYAPSIGILHLLLIQSKDQSQAHFHCEYLVNGEKYIFQHLQLNGTINTDAFADLPGLVRHPLQICLDL